MALLRKDASLTRFLTCFTKQWPTNRPFVPIGQGWTISLRRGPFWEGHVWQRAVLR